MGIRLAVLGAVAVVAVLAAVVIAGGGGKSTTSKTTTAANSALKGIPQSGLTLGSPNAPVTIVEFADLQCPFCAQYHRDVFPTILDRYVRTGKVRLELRLLRFLGPDSDKARPASRWPPRGQNRMWQFVGLAYDRQGQENSGYATNDFINRLTHGRRPDEPGCGRRRGAAGAGQARGSPRRPASTRPRRSRSAAQAARSPASSRTTLHADAFIPTIDKELGQ